MNADPNADVAKLSFEDAMRQLEEIVEKLDQGDAPLDESITIYERGAALRRHCEAKLAAADARVQRIIQAADGSAGGVADAEIG